jgi:hypothetical protein
MNSQPAVQNLAALEDEITLGGTYWNTYPCSQRNWVAKVRWREIFATISPYLIRNPNDEYVKLILDRDMFLRSANFNEGSQPLLDDQVFRTVGVQLQALRLVLLQYAEAVGGSMGLFWSLTAQGERLMMELRTVKRPDTSDRPGRNPS